MKTIFINCVCQVRGSSIHNSSAVRLTHGACQATVRLHLFNTAVCKETGLCLCSCMWLCHAGPPHPQPSALLMAADTALRRDHSFQSYFASRILPQLIILLYLLDNDTSWVILGSSVVGLLIEFWKVSEGGTALHKHDTLRPDRDLTCGMTQISSSFPIISCHAAEQLTV